MTGRRAFMGGLGGTVLLRPRAAQAQQRPAVPVIGYMGLTSPAAGQAYLSVFLNSLREAGYIDGRNVAIEYRWAQGHVERLPEYASQLVALRVAVIVATAGPAALAATKATQTIPIVFLAVRPVEVGLAASYSRPGGNATGVDVLLSDLAPKRLELLRDLLSNARSVAYFVNPEGLNPAHERATVEAAARTTGHDVQFVETRTGSEIEQAFTRLAGQRPDAIITGTNVLFHIERQRLVALAAQHAIPATYEWPDQARAGGLISYGPGLKEAHRLVGVYAGKILGGAWPADLPVQRLTRPSW